MLTLPCGDPDSIRQALQKALADCCWEDGSIRIRRLVSAKGGALVFYGEFSDTSAPVAVKIYRDPHTGFPDSCAARAAFAALERLYDRPRDDRSPPCIRPLHILEQWGALITEWRDSPTLSRSLFDAAVPKSKLLLERAGAWLAALHTLEPVEYRTIIAGPMIGDIENMLGTAPRRLVSYALPRNRLLISTLGEVTARPVPSTCIHGDFKPDNLFIDEGRVIGLDIGICSPNAGLIDVAHFENHLDLLLLEFRSTRHLRVRQDLVKAFELGYCRDKGLRFPTKALIWVRLYQALRLLLFRQAWSSPPKSWIGEWQLRYLIRRLTNELRDSREDAV